jgi:ribosomal protein L11 methyltransferase
MFFTFQSTQYIQDEKFHDKVLEWCQAEERSIYLYNDTQPESISNTLRQGIVTGDELAALDLHLRQAEQNLEFGGFVAGPEQDNIHSLCFFSLDDTGEQARLAGFVSNTNLALDRSPLQSPLLLLPLAALLRQEQTIQMFYLPFHEIWEDDFIRLALYYFAPGEESGWWQQANTQGELAELLAFPVVGMIEKWQEVTMEVKPDVLDYISRLFGRYGYQQRYRVSYSTPPEQEEAARAILQAYLPAGEAAVDRLEELRQSLSSLSVLGPLSKLAITERSTAYYEALWNKPDLFRVGEHILLTSNRQDFVVAPGEILIEIPPSLESFSLGPDGPHPSTALCLQLLEKHLDPARHTRLLDLGTGSGTLAIVAIYLGAEKVLALDAFRPAVDAARLNTAYNGVSDRIRVEAGSLGINPKKEGLVYIFTEEDQRPPFGLEDWLPFDAIICNTYAHVLSGLAGTLYEALRPGGLLISGGILKQRVLEVRVAFDTVGLKLVDWLEEDGWVSFTHQRPD